MLLCKGYIDVGVIDLFCRNIEYILFLLVLDRRHYITRVDYNRFAAPILFGNLHVLNRNHR